MNKEILKIALPSIITNVTVPLLGLVDLAIVGHISSASGIGAIAVGTLIFNMVYWIFNFLRIGSSGLTAQAFGRKDIAGIRKVFWLSVKVAVSLGLFVFILQRPIEFISRWLISPSDEVWQLAISYFRIRIWAAPAVLILFSMNGWFVGMQNSRIPMYIAVGQNIVNIILSYLLVFKFGMDIAGVALGTVLSQYFGLAAALIMWHLKYHDIFSGEIEQKSEVTVSQFFTINRDIFFRMVFMLTVTCAFTSLGAREGDVYLAVNSLLMQFFTLFSYFSDGFALAGEALTGRYIGAKEREKLRTSVNLLLLWGGAVALLFTALYWIGGDWILTLLTSDTSVIAASAPFMLWAILIPITSFAAFAWDGIYIGATASRQMLYTLIFGAFFFFLSYIIGINIFDGASQQNHVLWFSFIAYLFGRSLIQTILAKKVLKKHMYPRNALVD